MDKLSNKPTIIKGGILAVSALMLLAAGTMIGTRIQQMRTSETTVNNVYPVKSDRVLAFSEEEIENSGGDIIKTQKNYYLCDHYDLHVDERVSNKESLEVYEDERLGLGIKYGNCFLDQRMISKLIGSSAITIKDLEIVRSEDCGTCWDGFAYIVESYDRKEAPTLEYGIYNINWADLAASKNFDPSVIISFGEDPTSIEVYHHSDMCSPLVMECIYSQENGSGLYEFSAEEFEYEIIRVGDYIETYDQEYLDEMENWPSVGMPTEM